MPEVKQGYAGLEARTEVIRHWEALGYRMLHDDFDSDWKRGDEPHGTMTFTNEPELVIETPPSRDLEAEIDRLIARVEELEKRLT
jgi:hypothetical protein